MHIDNGFEIINEFLPTDYVPKVLEILQKNTLVTADWRGSRRTRDRAPR